MIRVVAEHQEHTGSENIGFAALLNILFTFVEVAGGLWTGSLAILSDALHDAGDSAFLFTSWIAERQSRRRPDIRRTFGYRRLSLLAAAFAAVGLVSGTIFIISRAIPRIAHPTPVNAQGMIWLAILGILINSAGFFRLKKCASLSERVLTWHLLEDVLGWVVVLAGALIMRFSDLYIIDPLITAGYSAFILWEVFKNLKEVFNILLEGVPSHIDLKHVKKGLLEIPGILGAHDMHVWSLEGETDIFTGHIVVEDKLLKDPDKTKEIIKDELTHHHIEYSTIELESTRICSGIECRLPQAPRD